MFSINKGNKQILFELKKILDCVPQYRNPMDTDAVITYMNDIEEVNNSVSGCIYWLTQKDEGEYEKEEYENAIMRLKEWVQTRKEEQWCGHLKANVDYS